MIPTKIDLSKAAADRLADLIRAIDANTAALEAVAAAIAQSNAQRTYEQNRRRP